MQETLANEKFAYFFYWLLLCCYFLFKLDVNILLLVLVYK